MSDRVKSSYDKCIKLTYMSIKFTPQEIASYRATAQRKWQESKEERKLREKHAWKLAELAAALLKEQFKATKVMVFGSLVQ